MVAEEPQSYSRVLSSMCTPPHPAGKAAAIRFLGSNPGDPATFPSIAALEAQAIDGLGELVGLDAPKGYIASGGTEANIQAVRIARNRASVDRPNIVIPESAHFSFRKAAALLGVEVRTASLDEAARADVDAMAGQIDEQTVMVAAVAGSTEYGRVDPVPTIASLADDHAIHCHVDAAWGGFVLPFTDYAWNFSHAAIDSISIDPHKLGRAAIPAGGFLVRSQELLDSLAVETPYLESAEQVTLGGTRSGAGVASTVAVLDELWPEGYQRQYERTSANARWCADAFEERGFAVREPSLPLVTAEIPHVLFDRLRERDWRISRTAAGELRIVCMPHVTRERLREFVSEIDAIRQEAEY